MKCISQERLIESYKYARSYGYDKLIKNYIKCSNILIDTELFSEPQYKINFINFHFYCFMLLVISDLKLPFLMLNLRELNAFVFLKFLMR